MLLNVILMNYLPHKKIIQVTFLIAIQYIFVLNYHMSITYAHAYIILFTKTLDSLLYYFIVSNQSTRVLLIKICNTIDIFYQIKEVERNHVFTGLIISILCYYNGAIMCIDGSCALLLFNLHFIVFNLIILFMLI